MEEESLAGNDYCPKFQEIFTNTTLQTEGDECNAEGLHAFTLYIMGANIIRNI